MIWLSKNDVVFKRTIPNSFLRVIFMGIYWISQWSRHSKEKARFCIKGRMQNVESDGVGVLQQVWMEKQEPD